MPIGIYERKPIIKEGDKYNRLTAIKFSHKIKSDQHWLFRCDCGIEKVIQVNSVKSGDTKSCGCFRREFEKKRFGANSPMFGKKHTEATKKKMVLASLGKRKSKEHIENMSKAMKKQYQNGRISPFEKMWKENPDFLRGENNPNWGGKNRKENNGNWMGGISKIDKSCRCMKEYKKWRSDVFERDNWTCRDCKKNKCYVTAHHIKGFSKIIKENNIENVLQARDCKELWEIENGKTLCEDCHKLTDNYKGRAIKSNH